MERYFELNYWLEIIALGLFVIWLLIFIIVGLVKSVKRTYRIKSKKWKYNYLTNKFERVDKYEN